MKIKDLPESLTIDYSVNDPENDIDCVLQGIDWLNKVFGDSSWHHKINTQTLDLGDSCRCVITQVFESDPSSSVTPWYQLWMIVDHKVGMLGFSYSTEHWIEAIQTFRAIEAGEQVDNIYASHYQPPSF